MICIIDYGAGNLGSIANMLCKLGKPGIITSNADDIAKADKLILPGVGRFDYGMSKLKQSGLIEILNNKVLNDKVPILGICLGAQLMTNSSEEGVQAGLGWFNAQVKKFNFDGDESPLRVPHMGWNHVAVNRQTSLILNLPEKPRFYFVHSYFIESNNASDIMLTSTYGREFVSGLNNENIYAVQFHPEKSHKYGLKLFENFLEL